MSRSFAERSIPIAALLALVCACGEDETENAPDAAPAANASASSADPRPRTLDRGDGCFVDVLVEGRGRELAAGDEVIFAYEARVCDSDTPFASTRDWPEPCHAKLDTTGSPALIAGLVRGLTGLRIGTKARIEVPPELAYGKEGLRSAGIPADASLVFEVEVFGVR